MATRIVPVGKVLCAAKVCYFAFMAGAGPDGALVHSLQTQHKAQLGRLAYYSRAARLFFTQGFPAFKVEFTLAGSGSRVTKKAVNAMATRIGNLGGPFRGLTDPSASLEDTALRLHLLAPPAVVSLPLWFLSGWLGLRRLNPLLRCVEVDSFSCSSVRGLAPDSQVDGEWLGQLPMQVSVVPNALRILLPQHRSTLRQQNAQRIRNHGDLHGELAQPLAVDLRIGREAPNRTARERISLDAPQKWI